ncbi:MAG: hypothetical protein LBS43_09385 [Prevotellaceae bacterium]|jgi:hypothetical protein|nr:hypothetical protein [Prevotellaceae bacterium]
MNYSIIKVTDKKLEVEFYDIQARLYRDDLNWIRPLDVEIKRIFDPKKNKILPYYKIAERL